MGIKSGRERLGCAMTFSMNPEKSEGLVDLDKKEIERIQNSYDLGKL